MAETFYFKRLSGAVKLKVKEGERIRPLRIKRGHELPGDLDLADGELDRLKASGALATASEWARGESVPHHARRPHRASLDPRSERDPEPVEEEVAHVVDLAPPSASADIDRVGTEREIIENTRNAPGELGTLVEAADAPGTDGGAGSSEGASEGSSLGDLASMSDEDLAGLWSGQDKPLVSDLVDMVGDDATLAERVKRAEEEGTGGHARPTLVKKLDAVIDGTTDEDDGE